MKTEQYWNQMVPEITVTNFNESMEFYTKVLGFQVRFTRNSPSFAYLYQETAQVMIEEHHREGWNIEPLNQPFGRGINFQIKLKDIMSIYKRISKSGIPFYREMKENSYQTNDGLIRQREFLIQDLDGYLLRFCQELNTKEKV